MLSKLALPLWLPLILLGQNNSRAMQEPAYSSNRQNQEDTQRKELLFAEAKKVRKVKSSLLDPATLEQYQQVQADVDRLKKLAGELQGLLASGSADILSLDALKRMDEIEKLTRKIRSQMRHW